MQQFWPLSDLKVLHGKEGADTDLEFLRYVMGGILYKLSSGRICDRQQPNRLCSFMRELRVGFHTAALQDKRLSVRSN